MPDVLFVDVPWLVAEAVAHGGEGTGTPEHPAVIGGAGQLGSNVVALLANCSACKCVRVIDTRPPPLDLMAALPAGKVEYSAHKLGSGSLHELTAALTGIDCVISSVTPDVQYATAEAFFQTNVKGVKLLLEAMKAAAVPCLVHVSSIAVTNHFVHSQGQCETDPLPPWDDYFSPYDISKRKGEESVMEAARGGDLAACSLRIGGIVASPRDFTMRNAFMVPGFVVCPSKTAPLDFMDVRDVSRALLFAAQKLKLHPETLSGEVFFCTGIPISPKELSRGVGKLVGYPFISIPTLVLRTINAMQSLLESVRKALGLSVPGISAACFLDMGWFQQTFDNGKVERALGFRPLLTIHDAQRRIAQLKVQVDGHFWSWRHAGGYIAVVAAVVVACTSLRGSAVRREWAAVPGNV